MVSSGIVETMMDATLKDFFKSELKRSLICFGLSICTIFPCAVFIYLLESRTIWETLYIAAAALTTVGWGDITCQTPAGRAFINLFSLVMPCYHSFVGLRLVRCLFFTSNLPETQPPEVLVRSKPDQITLAHVEHFNQTLTKMTHVVSDLKTRIETQPIPALITNTLTELAKELADLKNRVETLTSSTEKITLKLESNLMNQAAAAMAPKQAIASEVTVAITKKETTTTTPPARAAAKPPSTPPTTTEKATDETASKSEVSSEDSKDGSRENSKEKSVKSK